MRGTQPQIELAQQLICQRIGINNGMWGYCFVCVYLYVCSVCACLFVHVALECMRAVVLHVQFVHCGMRVLNEYSCQCSALSSTVQNNSYFYLIGPPSFNYNVCIPSEG